MSLVLTNNLQTHTQCPLNLLSPQSPHQLAAPDPLPMYTVPGTHLLHSLSSATRTTLRGDETWRPNSKPLTNERSSTASSSPRLQQTLTTAHQPKSVHSLHVSYVLLEPMPCTVGRSNSDYHSPRPYEDRLTAASLTISAIQFYQLSQIRYQQSMTWSLRYTTPSPRIIPSTYYANSSVPLSSVGNCVPPRREVHRRIRLPCSQSRRDPRAAEGRIPYMENGRANRQAAAIRRRN